MKKILITACMGLITLLSAYTQPACELTRPPLVFEGVAPSPWAINGNVNDWQTILGPYTGNNTTPYNPGLSSNWSYDQWDSPMAGLDINFMAYTRDDYNVFFYFRRKAVSNQAGAFYYFLDVNGDFHMNAGEPVVGAHINGQQVSELTLYRYVVNTAQDYVAGKGNHMVNMSSFLSDGYTIKGSVEKIFGGQAIPSDFTLSTNEKFSAALTENGIGVELAIPFRFLKNWLTNSNPILPADGFSYHLALQKSAAPYKINLVQDNGGNCCGFTSIVGYPTYNIISKNIQHLGGTTYRLTTLLQNETNFTEDIYLKEVNLQNIITNDGLSFEPEDISVTVYPDRNANGVADAGEDGFPYLEINGSYLLQPISYFTGGLIGESVVPGAHQTKGFIIDIVLPANYSIAQLSIELQITIKFGAWKLYCVEETGGGKGINPVGFDLTPIEENPPLGLRKEVQSKTMTNGKPGISKMEIFPNPARGTVNIHLPAGMHRSRILIQDLSGKTVYSRVVDGDQLIVVDKLPAGFYLVQAIPKGSVQSQYVSRLVIQ